MKAKLRAWLIALIREAVRAELDYRQTLEWKMQTSVPQKVVGTPIRIPFRTSQGDTLPRAALSFEEMQIRNITEEPVNER